MECHERQMAELDLTVMGQISGIDLDCWCRNNVTEFLDVVGCCEEEQYAFQYALAFGGSFAVNGLGAKGAIRTQMYSE